MRNYEFDGIEIDWEYPAANDRRCRPKDTANFVVFVRGMKVALGGNCGLGMTLAASIWYLQHFDVKAMEDSVGRYNVMPMISMCMGLFKSFHWALYQAACKPDRN